MDKVSQTIEDAARQICDQIFSGKNIWDMKDEGFNPFKERCRETARKIISNYCSKCGLKRLVDQTSSLTEEEAELIGSFDAEHMEEVDLQLLQQLKEIRIPEANTIYQRFRIALFKYSGWYVNRNIPVEYIIHEDKNEIISSIETTFLVGFLLGIIFGRTSKENIGADYPVWPGPVGKYGND